MSVNGRFIYLNNDRYFYGVLGQSRKKKEKN